MTTLKPFTCDDLLKFNNVNLDPLTRTFGIHYYLQFLARWPEYFQVAKTPSGEIMGYIMGKAEGLGTNWHGHVTALSVAPCYRRLGVAASLMNWVEDILEKKHAYFIDLFVRASNQVAITTYQAMGYVVYRTVPKFYTGNPEEDAFDMRKALSQDVDKKSIIPLDHPAPPEKV